MLLYLLLSGIWSYSQPAFQSQWINFSLEPDYDYIPYNKRTCEIKNFNSDLVDSIKNLNSESFDQLWSSIPGDSMDIENMIQDGNDLDYIFQLYGENKYGTIWKAFYDSSNLYVLFKHWDTNNIADEHTTKFEVMFQTSPLTNMARGRYERDFSIATSKEEKNESYARFIELGGGHITIYQNAIEGFMSFLGQQGEWDEHPFTSQLMETDQYMERSEDSVYRALCVIPFDIGLGYPSNPYGDIFNEDWIDFDPLSTPGPDTIVFDVGSWSYNEGERLRHFWSGDNARGFGSNYYSGILVFDSPLPTVIDTIVNYCRGDEASPLEAFGDNLKWYTVPGGSFTSSPPVPPTEEAGKFNYYVTETVDDIESDPVKITVEVHEDVELLLSDYIINTSKTPVNLTASANFEGEENIEFTWSGNAINTTGDNISYFSETPEEITVTAVTDNGCSDEDNILVLDEPDVPYIEAWMGQSYALKDGSIIQIFGLDQIKRFKDIRQNEAMWTYVPEIDNPQPLNFFFFRMDSTIIMLSTGIKHTESGLKVKGFLRAISLDGEKINEIVIPSEYPLQMHNELRYIDFSVISENRFIICFGDKLLIYDANLELINQLQSPGNIYTTATIHDQKIYALLAENNLEQEWDNYYLSILTMNLDSISGHEFSSHSRANKIINMDMSVNQAGNVFIVEDSYYNQEDIEGFTALVKYDDSFNFLWEKHFFKWEHRSPSSCQALGNGNILLLSEGNFLYNIGKGSEDSYAFYTGGDGMTGYLCNTDGNVISLSGGSGTKGYRIDTENGDFLPWLYKARLNHDETYNAKGTICQENEETGLKLELDPGIFLYDEDIVWSDGTTGPVNVIKDTGSYYAEFTWLNGNIGFTDTFIVSDHYEIIENPVYNLDYSLPIKICEGEENTIAIEVLNDNGGPYTYQNLTLDRTFDGIETISEEGTYKIRVVDSHGCKTDSFIYCQVKYPYANNLCMVTMDNSSGRNMIIWEKEEHRGIQSYRVLRGLGQNLVGTRFSWEDNYLVDSVANPSIMAYRYFLESIDTCGNSKINEISHKTIHLTANVGPSGEVNLIWQPYEGLSLYQYNIYRSTDSINFNLIGGLEYDPSISQFTDYNPPKGSLFYQIGIEGEFSCSKEQAKKSSGENLVEIFSNKISLNPTGSDANNNFDPAVFRVYPNPASERLIIEYPQNKGNSTVQLINVLGEIVYKGILNSNRVRLDLNPGYHNGLHLIQILDEKGELKGTRLVWIQ